MWGLILCSRKPGQPAVALLVGVEGGIIGDGTSVSRVVET